MCEKIINDRCIFIMDHTNNDLSAYSEMYLTKTKTFYLFKFTWALHQPYLKRSNAGDSSVDRNM